jgi:hypothetical protein
MNRYLAAIVLAVYTLLLLAAGAEVKAGQTKPERKAMPAAGKEMTFENAVRQLEAAEMFATGGVGYAGTKTPAGKAYDFLLTHPKGAETFRRLLDAPRRETQMFALAGLSVVAPTEAAKAYSRFENMKTTVKAASGCVIHSQTVAEIVAQAKKGVFVRQHEATKSIRAKNTASR